MNLKKRILFVDDDPSLLRGLQSVLYRDRQRWDMVFALGGELGIHELRKEPFDIVVSDMRMPGIDGEMLLNVVKDEYPTTVRILLSGYADSDTIVRTLPLLHQLLAKPCDAKTLRGALERSLDGMNIERDAKIHRIIAGVDRLPTPPEIYFDLTRLMQSPTTNISEVSEVVSRDPGLSAKVLQLVNSPYFGISQPTSSLTQAVARLGTDQLRYLALTTAVFSSPRLHDRCWFSLAELQRGAMRAAGLARALAEPALRDEAFAATLLHDVGHIVLGLGRGPEFDELHARARRAEPELALELELFGVSHVDVGARLLAIWGIPSVLVDAVQFHHDPGSAPAPLRELASIVHVADTCVQHLPVLAELNSESLARAGCAGRVQGWLGVAERRATFA
jgi:HD-like signal output (HDOD) protein